MADTLEIDNIPLAAWHYDILWSEVEFIDNSFYEPTHWSWTFGDGSTSADTSPTHIYADTGTYHVCLTVSNAYGADTFCREIFVANALSSAVTTFAFEESATIYPNPATRIITLQMASPLPSGYRWELYTIDGRPVLTEAIVSGQTTQTIKLINISSGLYFWKISDGSHSTTAKKLVIMHNRK